MKIEQRHDMHAWDEKLLANPDKGCIFQSAEFAEQKRLGGWTPLFLEHEGIALTVLEKKVPLVGLLWYLPKGPGIATPTELTRLLPWLKEQAEAKHVFLVKIEPELLDEAETRATFLKAGLLKARPIQPNASTVLLDLSPSLEDILLGLNQKGRHAIRRAERDGVTVERVVVTDKNCLAMYELLKETAEGSFSIRSYDYYKQFWQRFEAAGLGQLFFASYNDQVVAGAYGLIFGTKSTYKDGASIRQRTAYGASHLLQWELISWAKEQGALIHDFCGAPPAASINDPTHPHYGIGRFKTSFHKEVTDYIGVWDLVIQDAKYRRWTTFGERLAQRLSYMRSHENFF